MLKVSLPTVYNKQKGTSFIEVLIALVILVTGILGAIAMQASAKKGSFDALQRSLASALTQDIVERMRNNDPTALNLYVGTYGDNAEDVPTSRCNGAAALCNTAAEIRANDIFEWSQALRGANTVASGGNETGGLIDVIGCIAFANSVATVTISWEGREATQDGANNNSAEAKNCGTASSSRRQVTLQTIII